MNVLFSELLVETLAEGTQSKLARSERARGDIAPPARGSACEQQGSSLSNLVDIVLLECQQGLAGKCKGRSDVGLYHGLQVLLRDVKEAFPNTRACVPESDTNFRLLQGRPFVLLDVLEDSADLSVRIRGNRECGRL